MLKKWIATITFGSVLWLSGCGASAQEAIATTVSEPHEGPALKVGETFDIAVPGDSSIFARTGFDLLMIPPGDLDAETFESSTSLAAVRGRQVEKLSGQWAIDLTGAEPRSTLGDREPFVVLAGAASGGYGSEELHALPLGKTPDRSWERLCDRAPQGIAIAAPRSQRNPVACDRIHIRTRR